MPLTPLGRRAPLKLRAGVDVPSLLGMVRQGTPATIPDAAFQHLENIRFSGPKIVSRPGQQKATNAVTGPIEGFCDTSDIGAAVAPDDSGGGLLGAPGAFFTLLFNAGGQAIIRYRWSDNTVTAQAIPPLYDGTTPYYLFKHLSPGTDRNAYGSGALIDPVTGFQNPTVAKVALSTMVVTPIIQLGMAAGPGSDPSQRRLAGALEDPLSALSFYASFPEQEFGGIEQVGKTYKDSGVDDNVAYAFSPGTVTCEGVYAAFNGTIYAFHGGDRGVMDTIRKRAGAGSWSTLTLSSPPGANYHFYGPARRPVVYNSKLWFLGAWERTSGGPFNVQSGLFSLTTGDVMTQERTLIASYGSNDALSLNECFVFNGDLYYSYLTFSSPNFTTRLGKYNGAAFTDIFWDGNIGGVSYTLGINSTPAFFVPGDGNVYAAAVNSSTGDLWIIRSNGTDLSTWSAVLNVTSALGAGFSSPEFHLYNGIVVVA